MPVDKSLTVFGNVVISNLVKNMNFIQTWQIDAAKKANYTAAVLAVCGLSSGENSSV